MKLPAWSVSKGDCIAFRSLCHEYLSKWFIFLRRDFPAGYGFAGCIRDLTFRAADKDRLYDLGSPADGENFTPGCDDEFVQAVVALGINTNFLIAILVCLAIIVILVIAMAVYRRRRNVFGYVNATFYSSPPLMD